MILKPNDINQILKGYIDAALWTEEERLKDEYQSEYGYDDEEDDNEDDELEKLIKISANLNKKSFESFTREDIEPNSLIKAYTDIKKFLDLAGDSVIEAIEENGLEQLGHDIWLTRNGHGAGFFDHSYDDNNEKRLMQAAKALKEVTLYINDDVKLSFDNEHIFENKISKEKVRDLVNMAHNAITRIKGKDYAPDVHELQAWIDNYLNSGKKDLTETRQGLFDYLKQQLPNTPEYVIKDMIYRTIKTANDQEKAEVIKGYIDQFKNIKWELKTNFPITMDIFTDQTKKELESRIGGYIKKDIPNDEERLQLQRDKLKSQGISKEPIILFKAKNGKYDLAEGKHRTIEAFKLYPEGFTQPNVYIGLNAPWLNEAKKTDFSKEKSQGLHGWFARQGGGGKSQGWVDCNTCKTDPETGRKKCKSCGRKEGEKRSKYPACRPTPASCGTRGKGEKWGKKTNNESENKQGMKKLIVQKLHEMIEEGNNELQNYMFFNNLKAIKEAIDELLEMDVQAVDQILSDGHGWALDHIATSADDISEVYNFLNASLDDHDEDSYEGDTEAGYKDEYGSVEDGMPMMNEAEYKGKKVQLGKPTRGDVKKYKVFVKNKAGRVVKVNFGDKNMEIKRDNPKRRKSFRARHKCSQAKDRTTPKYWSCRMWSRKPVSKIVGENVGKQENLSIFVKESLNQDSMSQPQIAPKPQPKTTPNSPNKPYTKPVPTRVKPFLPEVAPGTKTDPKAGIKEGKFDFETYHKTLGDTLREIERYAISRGFDPIEFGPFDVEHVSYGSTRRISIPLSIDGMPKKNKYLQAQIYRMDSGNYELNMYVG